MNSYPHSDCKQCTESKQGWVHSVHTHGTQAARMLRLSRAHCAQATHTPLAKSHIVAPFLSCRSLPTAIQTLYHDTEPLLRALHVVSLRTRMCSCVVSQHAEPCRSAMSSAHANPLSRQKICVTIQNPMPCALGRVAHAGWPCRIRGLAVS